MCLKTLYNIHLILSHFVLIIIHFDKPRILKYQYNMTKIIKINIFSIINKNIFIYKIYYNIYYKLMNIIFIFLVIIHILI
jgi:hypothetical protein